MSELQPVAIIRSMGGLVFDAVFEEQHTLELEVTDNPVETGVVVSDHAYMRPAKLRIMAGVSDVKLTEVSRADLFQGDTRSRAAFDLLTKLQASAEPFTVQTGLRLYTSMLCTRIDTTQDKDTSKAFIFEAELREINVVTTQSVRYPPRKSRQAQAKKQKGEQQGTQQTDPAKKQSLLKKIISMGSTS